MKSADQKNTPLVSIVVNNYNYAQYLDEAIRSALAQTYSNIEVIVVDDGSTDGSRAIIDSFGDALVSVYKDNGGQASAFNVGFARASGDWILFLDADDVLAANAVEICMPHAGAAVSRISYKLEICDALGDLILGASSVGISDYFLGDFVEARRRFGYLPGSPTSGNMFRASDLGARMPIPEDSFRIAADLYLFWAAAQQGQVVFLPEELGKYRQHGANYFTAKKGRFGKEKSMLEKHLSTVLLLEELFEAPDRANQSRKLRKLPFPIYALAMISDSKLFSIEDVRLLKWPTRRILLEAWGCIVAAKGGRAKKSTLMTTATLLINELLPRSLARGFHRKVSQIREVKAAR
jgi:glycosyltransferase involved in cell wall biosynthesis